MQRRTLLRLTGLSLPCLVLPRLGWGATTINMATEGMIGDDVTNNSATFRRIVAAHPHDVEFFFPAGTYRFADIQQTGVSGQTFCGEGTASVLKYLSPASSYLNMLAFTDAMGITFADLALDNAAILHFGGVQFKGCRDIRISRVAMYDSAVRPGITNDCYAFVTTKGTDYCFNVLIEDSSFADLQVELDHVIGATVRNCTSVRSRNTAALGSYSLIPNTRSEQLVFEGNHITDPAGAGYGIAVVLDPGSTSGCTFRDIVIRDNTLVKTVARGGAGILLGTAQLSAHPTGVVFDRLVVERNVLDLPVGTNPMLEAMYVVYAASPPEYTFTNLEVRGQSGMSIPVRLSSRYQDGGVWEGNQGAQLNLSTHRGVLVQDNRMTPYPGLPAYRFASSRGQNVWRRNTYCLTACGGEGFVQLDGAPASDSLELPTPACP